MRTNALNTAINALEDDHCCSSICNVSKRVIEDLIIKEVSVPSGNKQLKLITGYHCE